MPPPQPRSSTVSPGRRSATATGLPQPRLTRTAPSGMAPTSGQAAAPKRRAAGGAAAVAVAAAAEAARRGLARVAVDDHLAPLRGPGEAGVPGSDRRPDLL